MQQLPIPVQKVVVRSSDGSGGEKTLILRRGLYQNGPVLQDKIFQLNAFASMRIQIHMGGAGETRVNLECAIPDHPGTDNLEVVPGVRQFDPDAVPDALDSAFHDAVAGRLAGIDYQKQEHQSSEIHFGFHNKHR